MKKLLILFLSLFLFIPNVLAFDAQAQPFEINTDTGTLTTDSATPNLVVLGDLTAGDLNIDGVSMGGDLVLEATGTATVGDTAKNSYDQTFRTSVWDTDNAVARTIDMVWRNEPTSAATPYSSLYLKSVTDGGAEFTVGRFLSNGNSVWTGNAAYGTYGNFGTGSYFGNTGTSTDGGIVPYGDNLHFFGKTNKNIFNFTVNGNKNLEPSLGAQTYPLVSIWSNTLFSSATDERGYFYHDTADFNIKTGKGNVIITPQGGSVVLPRTALGATTSSALNLENSTAAAAGAQQVSPSIYFRGNGWKTDATAESQPTDFQIFSNPVQGTSAPSGGLTIQSRINNGAWADRFNFTSTGVFYVGSTTSSGSTGTVIGGTLQGGGSTSVKIKGTEADDATAVALQIGNTITLTNSAAKIVSFYNDNISTEKAYIDKDGTINLDGGVYSTYEVVSGGGQGSFDGYGAMVDHTNDAATNWDTVYRQSAQPTQWFAMYVAGGLGSGNLGYYSYFDTTTPLLHLGAQTEGIKITPNVGGITTIGTGTTSHSLDSREDVLVSGELEVGSTLFADGDIVQSGLYTRSSSASVADDGTITLPDATSGWGYVMAGDNEEFARFRWTTAGVVTIDESTTNVTPTDTDANLCIYDSGTAVIIKNRLGNSKTIKYLINY